MLTLASLYKQAASRIVRPRCCKTPFVVLAQYRTGSNLLRSLLNSHSAICLRGEIFNVSELAKRHYWIKNPAAAIDSLYRANPPAAQAVGFKLMYNQLSAEDVAAENWPSDTPQRILADVETVNSVITQKNINYPKACDHARRRLFRYRSLKVIHLKRRNLFKTCVSTARALCEDNWEGRAYREKRLSLPPESCLAFFQETRRQEDAYDKIAGAAPRLAIYYEDLVSKQPEVCAGIQSFLGVPHETLHSAQKRQAAASQDQGVENYQELRDFFRDTEYRVFFEQAEGRAQ